MTPWETRRETTTLVNRVLVAVLILVFNPLGRTEAIQLNMPSDIMRLLFDDDIVVGGLIHCHSTFSDGTSSVEELTRKARKRDYDFIVVTDHLDLIETREMEFVDWYPTEALLLELARLPNPKRYGLENCIQACQKATLETGTIAVFGIEVTLGGKNDRAIEIQPVAGKPLGNTHKVHLLGIGHLTETVCQAVRDHLGMHIHPDYQGSKGLPIAEAQVAVTRIMKDANLAVVIAHPYLHNPLDDFPKGAYYTFHKETYQDDKSNIDGVEFFHEQSPNSLEPNDYGPLEALGVAYRSQNQGAPGSPSVTASSDYHGVLKNLPTSKPLPAEDWTNFRRLTFFGIESPFSWKEGMYWENCRKISYAIRNQESTIIAFSEHADPGDKNIWEGEKGLVFQNGQPIRTNDGSIRIFRNFREAIAAVSKREISDQLPFYFYIPGKMIMRTKFTVPKPRRTVVPLIIRRTPPVIRKIPIPPIRRPAPRFKPFYRR